MNLIYVILAIAVILALWAVAIYNRLVKLRNICKEAWSGIDVQLKRRANLIPNLIETVKGYAKHESQIFKEVTEARTRAIGAKGPAEKASAESALSMGIRSLFAIAEDYPELKANENFLNLQQQLSGLEEQIQLARRYYNGAVRQFNTAIEIFPNNMVAGPFGFEKMEFFELQDEEKRQVPEVKFQS
jgi:LemA protein